jgi:hypothetical protein
MGHPGRGGCLHVQAALWLLSIPLVKVQWHGCCQGSTLAAALAGAMASRHPNVSGLIGLNADVQASEAAQFESSIAPLMGHYPLSMATERARIFSLHWHAECRSILERHSVFIRFQDVMICCG